MTRTNLEPQSRGCSNQTVWRVPYSLSLYANQVWEMVTTVNTQEASESQKFPWLLLTTVPIKNPPIPSLTPPSLPDCSQCASQFLITLTSSGCTYMGEEKTSMWEPLPRGSVFPSAQKVPLLGTFVISLLPRNQAPQFPWTCRIPFSKTKWNRLVEVSCIKHIRVWISAHYTPLNIRWNGSLYWILWTDFHWT